MDGKWEPWTLSRVLVLGILLARGRIIDGYRLDSVGYLDRNPYGSYKNTQMFHKPDRISALDALNHVSKRGQERKGLYGFLGCVVNEGLCQKDEFCIDDGLFGSCQEIAKPFDRYQYRLDNQQRLELEEILEGLVSEGYTWKDLYTQCVVGDVLVAFQLNQRPDPAYCNDGTIPVRRSSGSDGEASKWSRYEELPNVEESDMGIIPSDSEFVDIHKYQKQRRQEPPEADPLNYQLVGNVPDQDSVDSGTDQLTNQKGEKIEKAILKLLMSMKYEDLEALDEWLTSDLMHNTGYDDLPTKQSLRYRPEINLSSDYTSMIGEDHQVAENSNEDKKQGKGKFMMDVLDLVSRDVTIGEEAEDEQDEDRILGQLFQQQLQRKRVIADIDLEDFKKKPTTTTTKAPQRRFDVIDTAHVYLTVEPRVQNMDAATRILLELSSTLGVPFRIFTKLRFSGNLLDFRVDRTLANVNASTIASNAMLHSEEIRNATGYRITRADVGGISQSALRVHEIVSTRSRYFVLLLALCGVITGLLLTAVLLYLLHRYLTAKEKIAKINNAEAKRQALDPSKEYQELCRQHMSSKLSEKPEPFHFLGRVSSVTTSEGAQKSPSSRSSTSSWSEEPVSATMDILTGHMILSYMEDHLQNKDRLNKEWESLKAYEPELIATDVADQMTNKSKNRYLDVVPYDHSRVILQMTRNQNSSDYINASTITDHDPRNPAYVVTQGPLENTVADFWQMVWEQGCVVIVNLTKLAEKDTPLCHKYWPSEGSTIYHIYEVHLVSEHIWCEDYLIRSFYLKNLQTNETRTVTQFHYITWPDLGVPTSCKALLDFRRKVNKSFRGRSCPILVHCSDGAGRSCTYCLIDMVLNRISKGVKEIDIAATLEHIRDQRMQAVKTKEQFQFVLATVAEEVHAILKALPQQ